MSASSIRLWKGEKISFFACSRGPVHKGTMTVLGTLISMPESDAKRRSSETIEPSCVRHQDVLKSRQCLWTQRRILTKLHNLKLFFLLYPLSGFPMEHSTPATLMVESVKTSALVSRRMWVSIPPENANEVCTKALEKHWECSANWFLCQEGQELPHLNLRPQTQITSSHQTKIAWRGSIPEGGMVHYLTTETFMLENRCQKQHWLIWKFKSLSRSSSPPHRKMKGKLHGLSMTRPIFNFKGKRHSQVSDKTCK